LSFPAQTVESFSTPQTVTLTNSGGFSLAISSIAASGPFSQTSNCGSAVPAGSSCAIKVTFAPIVYGAASGTLTVTDGNRKNIHRQFDPDRYRLRLLCFTHVGGSRARKFNQFLSEPHRVQRQ
jgi:HYDIN/CFA65/VesB-like, Ig-like domain